MNINRDFVSTENTYMGENNPKYIVIHETDNFTAGAGAQRHAQAQTAGNLSTSVHYYCGSDGVYQAAEYTDGTWSIGKEYGGNHSITDAGNKNSINIEICVNEDGDYNVARVNAIELVKYLIQVTGIPVCRVIRHYDAKGKYCPRKMLDNPALWGDFKAQIGAPAEPQPVPQPEPQAVPPQQTVTGVITTKKDPLRLRECPDGKPLKNIPKGAMVTVLEQGPEWHRVNYDGYTGYCSARYVTLSGTYGGWVGKCTGNGVRVRSTPDFGDNIMRKLDKGNLFDVLDVNGVWTYINVAGQIGYIYSDYVARS